MGFRGQYQRSRLKGQYQKSVWYLVAISDANYWWIKHAEYINKEEEHAGSVDMSLMSKTFWICYWWVWHAEYVADE